MSDQFYSTGDDSIDRESSDVDEDTVESEELSLDEFNDWGGGELEAAYMKALSALEASEMELPPESVQKPLGATKIENKESEAASIMRAPQSCAPEASNSPKLKTAPSSMDEKSQDLLPSDRSSYSDSNSAIASEVLATDVRPTPRQIIEACLFVGGQALPSTKLSTVMRGEFDSQYIDREIDELNRLYAAECRPYEIRLVEGGYRFTLREEFERIRHKVYGLGPKEVRLSTEALEVLAVVAYHQPIKQSRVEEMGKPGCGAILRQLVRRDLIAVERDPKKPNDVDYKTTPRFLSMLGIGSLEELPHQEQVSYK